MSEFKGTKGKWEATPYHNVYCMGSRVATIGDLGKITDEVKYNALLISKAPAMLEMLQYLSEKLGTSFEIEKQEINQLIKEATEL